MKIRVPLFIAAGMGERIANAVPALGDSIKDTFGGLGAELELLDEEVDAGRYIVISFVNALVWAVVFGALIFALSYAFEKNIAEAALPALASVAVILCMFMGIFLVYPSILLKKEAEEIDAKLIYALNDLVMQVTAGTSLTEAMRKVAGGKYGKVSEEFKEVVERMISGESQEQALTSVARKNKSEFMRRVLWQLATVLHTGASLDIALRDLIAGIRVYQNNRINQYSQNLNFYILIYLMLAVVLPSLTILLLTTISVFISRGGMLNIGRISLSVEQVMALATVVYVAGQVAVIEYIRVKRPLI